MALASPNPNLDARGAKHQVDRQKVDPGMIELADDRRRAVGAGREGDWTW
jgi:hypothetical protein